MSFRINTAFRSHLPQGRKLVPDKDEKSTHSTVLRFGFAAMVLIAACAGYAVAYPERMPESVGMVVENLTGENAHPVKLVKPPVAPLSAVALLGKQIFYDTSLSASGRQSCASCHSPDHAYGPANDLSVQFGGPHLTDAGYRPAPSLTYLYRQAPFSIGPDAGDEDNPLSLADIAASIAGEQRAQKNADVAPAVPALVPQGGLFWDGRASSFQRQALAPMLNPVEMANASVQDVANKLAKTPYRETFKQLFGQRIFDSPDTLVSEATFAVGRYEVEDSSFHAFTSKYDYWLEGKARLTQAELRGLHLFNDAKKANCAGCRLSEPTEDGLPPLFTDTQYEALGVPRNVELQANRDSTFYDLGVCGPLRTDLQAQTQFCGMFLTPTLRNIATRHAFFHNGVYHTLKQVMDFYNLRNTNPDRIYPRDESGKVALFNDIPPQYRKNVDFQDAPFDRKRGEKPPMTSQDIQDIVAFMNTLNDGYRP